MGRVAGYAAVLLLSVYLFFMYNDTVISGLVVFLLLYPAISGGYLLILGKKLKQGEERIPSVGEKGSAVRAGVVLKNTSAILGIRYEVKLYIKGNCEKRYRKRRLKGILAADGERTVWCSFTADICGPASVWFKEIRIYDFLGLFYIKRKGWSCRSVKIMPEFRLMPLEITRKTREFQADAEIYSSDRKGDDPAEIYQVREYRPEDSLKNVHWKLTAKENELMIKEKAFPLGCAVLLWFDVRKNNMTAAGFSEMIQKTAELSVTLTEEKCIHLAAWYDEKNEWIVRRRVDDLESCYTMIWEMMDMLPCSDIRKREICYRDVFGSQMFSSKVIIDGNGKVYLNGEPEEFLRL